MKMLLKPCCIYLITLSLGCEKVCVADMAPLEPAQRAIPPTGTKRLVQDTNSGAIYRDIVYFFPYLCINKKRKQ